MSSPEDLAAFRRAIREASEPELWQRLRGLIAAEPSVARKLRFEFVLLALKERGDLEAEEVCSTLALIDGRSGWAYGGFLLASLAVDEGSAAWVRKIFAESPNDLKETVPLLMSRNRPRLRLDAGLTASS